MFPRTTLDVIGVRSRARIDAVIDTGFFGDICLPARIAEPLGLILEQQTAITLANGSSYLELVFGADIEFMNVRRRGNVFVFDREYALVGLNLLKDCQLVIDFPTQKVNLFRTQNSDRK